MEISYKSTGIGNAGMSLKVDNTTGKFKGYLSTFNGVDLGGDMIRPGAYAKTLADWGAKGFLPPLISQHGGWQISSDDAMPIGKFTKMVEDDHGLYVEAELFQTSLGKDWAEVVKNSPAGSIGMSIGYSVKRCRRPEEKDDDAYIMEGTKPVRVYKILEEIELYEGSLVTFPMDTRSVVEASKSATIRDAEEVLRSEYGLSRKDAKEILSRLRGLFSRSEDDKAVSTSQISPATGENSSPEEKNSGTETGTKTSEEDGETKSCENTQPIENTEENSGLDDWFAQKTAALKAEREAIEEAAKLEEIRKIANS